MLEDIDTERFVGERVGVALGGSSSERAVSLKTGEALAQALRDADGDYDVETYDFPSDLDRFVADPPAAVLIAFHGGAGENGTIQGFFETLGVPYTGSGVLASALALDKTRSKALFADAGLMTPASATLAPAEVDDALDDLTGWLSRHDLQTPLVVKPTDGGSSQGVSLCQSDDELVPAIEAAADELGDGPAAGLLVEEYIDGPEFTVGFFDGECLGALEVVPGEDFYDYEAKYESDETEYRIVEEPGMLKRLEAAGRLAYRTLGCRGVARVDFMARTERSDQILYALEVNTIPGMTATSLVPKLAKDRGVSFERFAELMLSTATLDVNAGAG